MRTIKRIQNKQTEETQQNVTEMKLTDQDYSGDDFDNNSNNINYIVYKSYSQLVDEIVHEFPQKHCYILFDKYILYDIAIDEMEQKDAYSLFTFDQQWCIFYRMVKYEFQQLPEENNEVEAIVIQRRVLCLKAFDYLCQLNQQQTKEDVHWDSKFLSCFVVSIRSILSLFTAIPKDEEETTELLKEIGIRREEIEKIIGQTAFDLQSIGKIDQVLKMLTLNHQSILQHK